MFQYTKENILNSIPKYTNDGKKIMIEGLGEYVIENIVDKAVYVTAGETGNPGKIVLDASKIADAGEYLLTFRVITPNQYLAEYASPNWQVFGKPIVVGFGATKASDVDALYNAIVLAIPDGNKFIKITKETTDVTLEGTSNYMTFDKVQLVKIVGEKEEVVADVVKSTVKNVEPFATKEWIIENLRFPTYPNIRYASASTMPTADLYTEFAFTYRVPRIGLGGLSGVGQAIDAVTRHIFYVPTTLAGDFETNVLAGLTSDSSATSGESNNYEDTLQNSVKEDEDDE